MASAADDVRFSADLERSSNPNPDAFRGLHVTIGPGRAHTHVDDLRGVRNALAEATAADGVAPTTQPPPFAPSLIVGDFCTPAYGDLKRQQLSLAADLWRVRRRIRSLESAQNNKRPLPLAGQVGDVRHWTLCSAPEPAGTLPPEAEQEAVLFDLAAAAGLGAGTAGGLDLPALEDLLVTDFFAAAAGLEPAAGGLGLARFAGGGEVNLFGFEIFLFARPSLTPLTAGGGVAAGATADMVRTSRCQGTTRTAYRAGRVRHARSLVPYPVAVGSIFELFRAVWNLSARKVGRFLLGFDAFTRAVTRPSRPAGFGAPVRSPQPSRASPRPVFRVPPACVPRGQRAFRSIRGS